MRIEVTISLSNQRWWADLELPQHGIYYDLATDSLDMRTVMVPHAVSINVSSFREFQDHVRAVIAEQLGHERFHCDFRDWQGNTFTPEDHLLADIAMMGE